MNDFGILDHLRAKPCCRAGKGGCGEARVGVTIHRRIGTGQHLCTQKREPFAQHVAREQFQIEALFARFCGVIFHRADILGPIAEADADVARLQIFHIRAEQFVRLPPDAAGAVGQWQLENRAALAADIAEVGPAGLPPDFIGFEQHDRQPALRQKERSRTAHQAAADDRNICGEFRRAHASAFTVPTDSGLTGACPRKRPAHSTGCPRKAATISAEALPQ